MAIQPCNENLTQSASLLEKTGVLSMLRAACLTLLNSEPDLVRSMMISVVSPQSDDQDDAVRRYAEEHCVVADVERHGPAMVIKLRRADSEAAGGSR